jgi:hypothetical protein
MRTALIVLMWIAAVVALAVPSNLTSMELSYDNGNVDHGPYTFVNGAGSYVAIQFDFPSGGPWYLSGIKYYVYPGYPDSIYQGYGVACWLFEGGLPTALVWPLDGALIYNPNTGGNWIVQPVTPNFNLTQNCPTGFVLGIEIMYDLPNNDAIGSDDTGPGTHDWWHFTSTGWSPASYGKNAVRALINDIGNPGVETSTIGQIRALYR